MWYQDFPTLNERVTELKNDFESACNKLGVDSEKILTDFTLDLTTQIVHASNWQEGLKLDRGKTQKFAELAILKLENLAGPRLDLNWMLEHHRAEVATLFKQGSTTEEVGAYNLTTAHIAILMIQADIFRNKWVAIAKNLEATLALDSPEPTPEFREMALKIIKDVKEDQNSSTSPYRLTGNHSTLGEANCQLLLNDLDCLEKPVTSSHIHFLHSITMMGIMPPSQLGVFRKGSVHVGNPDLVFPPASAIPEMMKRFCAEFPVDTFLTDDNLILTAAKVSHRFVHIHPYEDGNGRISRLIMNLFLAGDHPPAFIKADSKGRHRYATALKRADQGKHEALAALIAKSLIEIYEKMIESLSR